MYGKIFEEIFDGSLMIKGGPMATYLFMSMIVLADENGIVRFTPEALGKRVGMPDGTGSFLHWNEFRESLKILESEDDESNLSAEDGRRIIPMDRITNGEETRGWWIVNYEFYRKKAGKFDQKDKTKERVRRFRERNKRDVTQCNGSNENETHSNEKSRHTDTDTDIINSSICSQQKIVDLYHEILPQLNKVRVLNSKRRACLRSRWNQKVENIDGLTSNCLEWWRGFFKYVRTSDFLMGRLDGDRPFQADFDFLIKESSLTKVVEGFYHRKRGS
jgi:hypothetical protein